MKFKDYLKQELATRNKRNPCYSLRSFARDLKIGHSALSAMLRGTRPITEKMKERLGSELKIDSVQLQLLRTDQDRRFDPSVNEYQQLALDHFSLIKDWYHFALLELIHVRDFRPNTDWIADQLGITVAVADQARDRLFRLGLIHVDDKGQWKDTTKQGLRTNFDGVDTQQALRHLQQNLLELSQRALNNVEFGKRDHSSMTMAISKAKLPMAKARIKKFRRELCQFLEAGEREEVYHLQISLFPTAVQGAMTC